MGLRSVTMRAFNCGTKTQLLSGFAGVRLLDQAGNVLPVAIKKGVIASSMLNPKPVDILLTPGQSATAALSWRNMTTQENPITASFVRMVAARGLDPQTLPLTVDLGNTGRIAISAWEPYTP